MHGDLRLIVRLARRPAQLSSKPAYQRWFTERIMPYRRLDNVIDGAVITFVEITAAKQLESDLRQDSKG